MCGSGDSSLDSDLSPVVTNPGVIDVFWKGWNGDLWHKWFTGSWQGPAPLNAGPLGSAPHAVGQSTGAVDIFWKGTDGQLWHEGFTGAAWYGPEPLGGSIPPGSQLSSDPSPTVSGDGTVDVFWKGTDANLWHKRLADGGNDPENLGAGPLGSGPFAVVTPNGTTHVFWRGTDGQSWHEQHDLTGWFGPEPLGDSLPPGSQLSSDPSPVVSSEDVVNIFWRGTDGGLWHKAWLGSSWRGPEPIGIPIGSTPSASGQPSGKIDVFWVGAGATNQVCHDWSVNNGNPPWYGPEALGGSVW